MFGDAVVYGMWFPDGWRFCVSDGLRVTAWCRSVREARELWRVGLVHPVW